MEEDTVNENNPQETSLYEPSDGLARLDLETEQMMDSVQTFLMTPPSNKQTSGQSSAPDLLPRLCAYENTPSVEVEIDEKVSSSPFIPTGDLLNLQNETEAIIDSMKSSFMTPPPGFEECSTSHETKKSNAELAISPFALSDDLAKLQDETEGMMDSIKSSLMTPQTKVPNKFDDLDKNFDPNRDDTQEDLPRDVSFFSDDGINEEIHTLDEAMPNLKEDLQKMDENSEESGKKEDNMHSFEGRSEKEEVHETVEEAGDEAERQINHEYDTAISVEVETLTYLQNLKDSEELDFPKDSRSIEERLSKEIYLAKEELLKSDEPDCTKDEQDRTLGNMVCGSEMETGYSQTDIHILEVKVDKNKSCAEMKDSRMETNDEGLVYELAMIPVDLVNVMIESKIVRRATSSGIFSFVSSVVITYPREVLVVIIAIYFYRTIKVAFLET